MARLEVGVQYATRSRAVPGRAELVRWARGALAGRRSGRSISIRIVDRAEARALNARWRGRRYVPNVLSFPAAPPAAGALGDIVLCAPVVNAEARAQAKPRSAHWAHLVVHGSLHLIGFDHDAARRAIRMEALERRILARMGYADPYAERHGP